MNRLITIIISIAALLSIAPGCTQDIGGIEYSSTKYFSALNVPGVNINAVPIIKPNHPNFDNRGNCFYTPRASRHIDIAVIHTAEGYYDGTISELTQDKKHNECPKKSAHFLIPLDPKKPVVQFSPINDITWHAGNREYNARSIGIEQVGFTKKGHYPKAMIEAAARIIARAGIPADRQHIIGHHEVPHPDDPSRRGGKYGHTDPGPDYNFDMLVDLVKKYQESSNNPNSGNQILSQEGSFRNNGNHCVGNPVQCCKKVQDNPDRFPGDIHYFCGTEENKHYIFFCDKNNNQTLPRRDCRKQVAYHTRQPEHQDDICTTAVPNRPGCYYRNRDGILEDFTGPPN